MSNQTQQTPGWGQPTTPQPPTTPPHKRHVGRNIALAIVALFVLGSIVSAINSGGTSPQSTTPAATEGPTSPSADTAAATTAPPTTEPPATQPAVKPLSKTFSGSGSWNSPPFVLRADAVKVTFHYTGNYIGGTPSNFIASLEASDDSLSITNDIAGAGGKTTTVYPTSPGSRYHLEIMADGHWTVTVQEQS